MEPQRSFLESGRVSFYSGVVVAIAFVIFASSHFVGFQRSGEWILLLFCFAEGLTAVFMFFRSSPETVSANRFDWIVGTVGTFAPLLLRPAPWGIAPLAKYAIIAGVMIQAAGLISLNRSIAIVAAKREIKTRGMYRLVRHPLYASYIVTFSGYVLMNSTIENFVVYALTISLLFLRCYKEETHLVMDPSYAEYMRKVNYRIIPFVY